MLTCGLLSLKQDDCTSAENVNLTSDSANVISKNIFLINTGDCQLLIVLCCVIIYLITKTNGRLERNSFFLIV